MLTFNQLLLNNFISSKNFFFNFYSQLYILFNKFKNMILLEVMYYTRHHPETFENKKILPKKCDSTNITIRNQIFPMAR